MLSKNSIKHIQSLAAKKYRLLYHEFIAEGEKIAVEIFKSELQVKAVYATKVWLQDNFALLTKETKCVEISENELTKISSLHSPNKVLLICSMPKYKLDAAKLTATLTIALDTIQDPGNLGTIIRLADWFGIKNIVCNEACVDCYNPKVIQASMASIARVKVHYADLITLLRNLKKEKVILPVYGALLQGKNIYKEKLTQNGIIIMGNESKGISPEIKEFITNPISIPNFSTSKEIDSLNVAMATAIICSEFRRGGDF